MMRVVALGLSYAHAEGIVHRDIKPSNLMLSHTGDVKVLDFGLAQVSLWDEVSAELTTVGQLMGTLDYMAPEQAERPDAVDYRADLYSLGQRCFDCCVVAHRWRLRPTFRRWSSCACSHRSNRRVWIPYETMHRRS